MNSQNQAWKEEEYLKYLDTERRLYAWCLVRYGKYDEIKAKNEALEFYEYEGADEKVRGLVFHDQAWHWAMQKLHGDLYWKECPELESPSSEYEKEARNLS